MRILCSTLCLIFCVILRDVEAVGVCDEEYNPDTVAKIRLIIYKGNISNYTYSEGTLAKPKAVLKDIVYDKETVVYAHGFLEIPTSDNVLAIVRAYLDARDVNLILIDWSKVSIDINYFYVSRQVVVVGKAVAEFLEKFSDVIDLNKLHVVGHSLGSHVAAQIGRSLNGTIPRITGLDPAFPLFYPSTCHIRPTDAEAVVILHTDGGVFGTPIDTGTVDFYANKGVFPQPGCPIIIARELCSHQRSIKLYAESIKNPKAFPAHKCSNKSEGKGSSDVAYFGDNTPKDLHGSYCFTTNSESPYGKGPTS